MKSRLLILFVFTGALSFAQYKPIKQVSDKALELHKAIFIDKDSLALESLLSYEVNYGHSGGKVENRKEVIDNASHNKSTYTDIKTEINQVIVNDNTAVVRCLLTGTETKEDGKVIPLKLSILQTWTKVKKNWKLMGRQAVKGN
ncbi:MAG: nuclear transport factor 2 family protein [Bacteroidetes bacterium]|nr:nuclear transport factor 2 family protein [Bacteroidota bacterium]